MLGLVSQLHRSQGLLRGSGEGLGGALRAGLGHREQAGGLGQECLLPATSSS